MTRTTRTSVCSYWRRQDAREDANFQIPYETPEDHLLADIFRKPTDDERREDLIDPPCNVCERCILVNTPDVDDDEVTEEVH